MVKCILTNFRIFYTSFPIKSIFFKFYKIINEFSIIFEGIVFLFLFLKIGKLDSWDFKSGFNVSGFDVIIASILNFKMNFKCYFKGYFVL